MADVEAAAADGNNRSGRVRTSDCKAPAISESESACPQRFWGAPESGGGARSNFAKEAGPSLAAPSAAADNHAAADRDLSRGHHAANPLSGGAFPKPTDKGANNAAEAAPAAADTVSTEPPISSAPEKGGPSAQLTDQDSNRQQQQQLLLHEPVDRQQARQADGDALTSPRQRDTSTPPPHILRPRRISLDIDLLMPAALPSRASCLSTVSVDSSRHHLSSRASAGGSGNISSAISSGSRSSPCSPLYGNLLPHKTKALSVKVPLGRDLASAAARHSNFQAASSLVAAAAIAAIARQNAAAAAAAAAAAGTLYATTAASVGAAGQVPDVAASSLEGPLPRVVPLSCVCVKGCVHLLMLLHEHAGGGHRAAELGVEQLQQHEGMDNDGAGGVVVRHTTIGLGSSWDMSDAGDESGLEVNLGAAVEAAVLGMLSMGAGGSSADGGGGGRSLGSGGAAGLAAVWPPAVAVDEGTGGVSVHAADEAGSGAEPAGPEEAGQANAGSVEVVVACGVPLLRGLEAVRCVVAGQEGRSGAADPED